MFSKETLKDKNILITGGGSGLGLAMAEKFAELGANIAICGRNEEKLQLAAEKIRSFGTQVEIYALDIREYAKVDEMYSYLFQKWGKIDGLVNNAAGNFVSASEDLSPNGFKAVVDIVLHGTFNCTHLLGKRWIDSGAKGNILNIVTTYTETGCSFVLPSACAKAGVYALTTTLAYEWGIYGIRVNAIAPGPFPTEGAWSRLMPGADFEKLMVDGHPMKRVGEREELANLATFLLSDLASYINGECVVIDGGERLQGAQFNRFTQLLPREQLKQAFRMMRGKGK